MSKRTKQQAKIKDSKRKKVVRTTINPDSYDTCYPSWRFCRAIDNHKWSISRLDWALFLLDVYPKLKAYEKMTWNEIKSASKSSGDGSQSHNIPIVKFPTETKKELESLNLIDIDELFSLRIGSLKRIYGILEKVYWK